MLQKGRSGISRRSLATSAEILDICSEANANGISTSIDGFASATHMIAKILTTTMTDPLTLMTPVLMHLGAIIQMMGRQMTGSAYASTVESNRLISGWMHIENGSKGIERHLNMEPTILMLATQRSTNSSFVIPFVDVGCGSQAWQRIKDRDAGLDICGRSVTISCGIKDLCLEAIGMLLGTWRGGHASRICMPAL